MRTESYKEFEDGPWLSKKSMEWFVNAYLSDSTKKDHYTVSVLNSTNEQLRNLPQALIITDENDVLRDEGEKYAHKLMNAGVEVVTVRYLGTIHDFLILKPLKETSAVKNALNLIIMQINNILNQK